MPSPRGWDGRWSVAQLQPEVEAFLGGQAGNAPPWWHGRPVPSWAAVQLRDPAEGARGSGQIEVRALAGVELREAAGAAARALQDDPASVACYGADALVRLAQTFGLFADLFQRSTVPQYGALCGGCVVGVSGVLPPGTCVGALMAPYVQSTLANPEPPLGDPLRPMVLWATWAAHDLAEEHWHIGPVGVEPGYQGMGIGRAVMESLCAELDEYGRVGWLETNKERNIRFYGALGFELVHEAVALGVPSWFMRRHPR
jgi:ribosomal protein S18 acetylase RimI-like enzyme